MATEPDATTQPNLATAVAEVGTAVERHSILWLTNVSHAVNHFQNQMVAVLYVAVMPELGFGPAQLGLLTAVYSMAGGSIQGLYGFVTPFMRRTWILGIGNLVMGAGTLASGFRRFFRRLCRHPGCGGNWGERAAPGWLQSLIRVFPGEPGDHYCSEQQRVQRGQPAGPAGGGGNAPDYGLA